MLEMVNQLLNSESMESGIIVLAAKPVQIGPIVADSCQVLERTARLKGLDLTIEIEPGTPELISCDPVRLQEVLVNLIGNAVKYTEEGVVSVHASQAAEGFTRFEIRDTGIGISADDINRIFERHHRVEGHRATYAGTGLGLSIVKELVEAMGGTLGVKSTVREGSVFWFELPIGDVAPSIIRDVALPNIARLRKSVLVATISASTER